VAQPAAAVAFSPGDLVINEIMQNPSAVADSAGEWFEIYNNTAAPVDLQGLTVSDNDIDSFTIGTSVVVAPGGFAVLGNNASSGINGGVTVDYQYPSNFFLGNSADELVIFEGAVEIDRVEWDNGATFPDPNGASMALNDTANDNNVGANWCTSTTEFGFGDKGTPGAANDCSTGGGLSPGDLVINEIMQNPAAVFDSNGEWFEVYNNTAGPVDLIGLTIKDNDFDTHTIGSSVVVAAGDFAVLARNADFATNGGVTADYQYSNFFLGNSADEVVIEDGGVEIDRVNYDGGPSFPDPTGAAMALNDTANDNNDGSNWCTASTTYGDGDSGTPGAANDCPTIPDLGVCSDGLATLIHTIQGSGASSPLVGQYHVIEGVVVGDFQGSTGLNGFFVQEEDTDADADPLTSEGIFVFDASFGVAVDNGDVVRVRGVVAEFFGLTRISSVLDVVDCTLTDTASAATVTFPLSAVSDLEHTEGMLVTIPQTLYASGNFNQARWGEVDLSVGGPLDNPTNVVAPGAAANALQDLNNRSRIQLDDGNTASNPSPAPYIGEGGTLRTGDTIPGLTAVLGYAFGNYELHPTAAVNFTRVNERPDTPDVGGELTVAAYNVLNYFTTIDNGDSICGPLENQRCRGADTAEEFTRQRKKIITATSTLDADVLGLMEIENAPDNAPEADLVAGLNAATAPGTYDYIATGPIGEDVIRVALLYQPAAVTPLGGFEVLDSTDDPLFDDARNRPMLVQSFVENATGEVFTVGVNHLKSKGSNCN
jgi:predicted extracellular nuclease